MEILTRHWEKHILSLRFSELGAIRFDRDLRAVSGYLGSQVEFADAREKFQRLQQISTLLNLDEVRLRPFAPLYGCDTDWMNLAGMYRRKTRMSSIVGRG